MAINQPQTKLKDGSFQDVKIPTYSVVETADEKKFVRSYQIDADTELSTTPIIDRLKAVKEENDKNKTNIALATMQLYSSSGGFTLNTYTDIPNEVKSSTSVLVRATFHNSNDVFLEAIPINYLKTTIYTSNIKLDNIGTINWNKLTIPVEGGGSVVEPAFKKIDVNIGYNEGENKSTLEILVYLSDEAYNAYVNQSKVFCLYLFKQSKKGETENHPPYNKWTFPSEIGIGSRHFRASFNNLDVDLQLNSSRPSVAEVKRILDPSKDTAGISYHTIRIQYDIDDLARVMTYGNITSSISYCDLDWNSRYRQLVPTNGSCKNSSVIGRRQQTRSALRYKFGIAIGDASHDPIHYAEEIIFTDVIAILYTPVAATGKYDVSYFVE